jgi:type I restriction enzyme S subunit
MTPEAFLSEFGAVANAPGGVQRLREMILQLAVQGKLVEQNAEDEPASELLERIAFEKAELIKKSVFKNQKQLQKVIQKDIAYLVPSNWIGCSFGSIWELISGRDLSTSQYNDSQNGIPYITGASNIKKSRLIVNRWTDCPTVVSKVDDLLISCKGTIGKTVFNTIGDSHIARQIMAIRGFTDNLDRFFLKLWLDGFVFKLVEKSKSMIPGFSREDLLTAPYPLPPLEEQKRIVAKVDQLMALCDQLDAQQQKRSRLVKHTRISALEALANVQGGDELQTAWKRVEENLPLLFEHPDDVEDLKKCILQNAVMGKLVPQNPDDEPASELLKKIAKEKAELIKKGEIKRQDPLPEIREDEKPFEVPEGWAWGKLGDSFHSISDGDHKAPPKSHQGIPFLVIGNVSKGFLDFSSTRFVTEEYFLSLDKVRTPTVDDILYTVTGSFGIPIEVDTTRKFCVQRHMAILKPSPLFAPFFWKNWLKSSLVYKQAKEKATGIAQKTVSLTTLRNIITPIPPITEQMRIIEKVKILLDFCDTLQKQLARSRNVAEQLAQSIVESITGISTEKQEPMKAPKTELVSLLKLVKKPGMKDHAPLSAILVKNNDELTAKSLWNNSGLPIDGFYRQLKIEMVNGWIDEPEKAKIRILDKQGKPQ